MASATRNPKPERYAAISVAVPLRDRLRTAERQSQNGRLGTHSCPPLPHLDDKPKFERTVNRSEEHTSELQSLRHLVCRLLLEKIKNSDVNGSYFSLSNYSNNLSERPYRS